MRVLTTVLGLSLLLTSCSTFEVLDGLCYNDRDGTYICPKEEERNTPAPQGEPIRNQYEHCEPWLPHMPEAYMECVLIA